MLSISSDPGHWAPLPTCLTAPGPFLLVTPRMVLLPSRSLPLASVAPLTLIRALASVRAGSHSQEGRGTLEFTRVSKTSKSAPVNPEVSISGDQVNKSRRSFQAFHPASKGSPQPRAEEEWRGNERNACSVLCGTKAR